MSSKNVPLIARIQAMNLLGLEEREQALLEGTDIYVSLRSKGKNFLARSPAQQDAAFETVLSNLFHVRVGGLHLGSQCPLARREQVLSFCKSALPHLQRGGYTAHEALEWYLRIEKSTEWSGPPRRFY